MIFEIIYDYQIFRYSISYMPLHNNANRLQIDDSNIHLSAHAQINIRLQRI